MQSAENSNPRGLSALSLVAVGVLLAALVGGIGVWFGMGLGQRDAQQAVPPATVAPLADTSTVTVEPAAATTEEEPPAAGNDALAAKYGSSVFEVESEGCGVGGSGTAWVVDEHHLVTNWHVVSIDPQPTVVSRDGKTRLQGTVIGGTSEPDIAVIKVDETLDGPLSWAETSELREGQEIVSMGYPAPEGDFAVTPSTILSFQMAGSVREAIRGDGALDYGNSGGPALTKDGEVAGVATVMVREANQLQMVPLLFTADALEAEVRGMIADPQSVEAECDPVFAELPSDWWEDFEGQDFPGPDAYGDDVALDQLYDACAAGDLGACDELWRSSPWGSDYEAFANTCGGSSSYAFGSCVADQQWAEAEAAWEREQQEEAERLEAEERAAQQQAAAALQGLVDSCQGGDMSACDDLQWEADYGSAEYDIAEACGGHYPDGWGSCVDREADAAEIGQLVGQCEGGDMDACDTLYWMADSGTPAYQVAYDCGGRHPGQGGSCAFEEEFGDW